MNAIYLLPCPFCGSADTTIERAFLSCYVICHTCAAEGPSTDTQQEAARVWNEHTSRHMTETEQRLTEERDLAILMLAEWCDAVRDKGTGWDDWDDYYKNAAFRPGPLRALIDAARKPEHDSDNGIA